MTSLRVINRAYEKMSSTVEKAGFIMAEAASNSNLA